jgi:hypothetical protein
MSAPDILAVAHWLQDQHRLFLFTVDHPARPECGGTHLECDGQRGKHPRGRWPKLATLSPRVIRAMLADGPWNIAVACKRSGVLGVDEDRLGAFAEFATSIGETIPATFRVRTKKGLHYYFRQAEGCPLGNGRGQLAGRGIDIRGGGAGDGGYFVGPGSVHQTGITYTPVDTTAPIGPVPTWLTEVLSEPPRPRLPEARVPSYPLKVLTGLAKTVLAARQPGPGRSGERNNTLYWAACRAWEHVDRGQIPAEAAQGTLLDAARQVGITDKAALATIDSARRMTGGGSR